MKIGIKVDGEKVELKDYKYNIKTGKRVYNDCEEFSHYFYDKPEDHFGFKLIHKDYIKEVLE